MRLNRENKLNIRKGINFFIVQNPHTNKLAVVNHFTKQGYARRTIYDSLKRVEEGLGVMDRHRSGRPRKLSKKAVKRLVELGTDKVGVSYRKLGSRFKVSKDTIKNYFMREGIKYYKRLKTPRYTIDQHREVQKICCRLLRKHLSRPISIIIDDEKYFGFYNDEDPSNSGYYTRDKNNTPSEVKNKGKEKYPQKILVWLAFSEKGISKPMIRLQPSTSINAKIYLEE